MNKMVKLSYALVACGVTLLLGVAIMYMVAIRPLQTEAIQYQTALYWVNWLNRLSDFGRPIGVAWKGKDLVIVYPTGFKVVVDSQEVYALDHNNIRAPYFFWGYPGADLRQHYNPEYLLYSFNEH